MASKASKADSAALIPMVESPLRHVTFEQALEVQPLLEATARAAQKSVDNAVAAHAGDAAGIVINSFQVIAANREIVVEFTEAGRKLKKAGVLKLVRDGSNRLLPKLKNAKGKFVETARLSNGAAKAMRIGTAIGTIALSAAHLVTGADLAKKLRRVEGKLDFLVAARRISQLSRLEAVFRQARELAHLPSTAATRWELHRLGRELFELRAEWRRELVHRLEILEHVQEGGNWFFGFFQRWGNDAKSQENTKQITQSEVEIWLLDVSMALHVALAQSSDTLETFLSVSLPDELAAVEQTKDLLVSKRAAILQRHAESQTAVQATIESFDATLERFRALVLPEDLKLPAVS